MTATATPQLRWSSTRDCPRKAIYEATNAPARERTQQEERTLYRGRSVGHDFVVALANENRWKIYVDSGPNYWVPPEFRAASEDDADVIAELRVAWQMGTGHVDLYIRQTDTVLEVLSSQHATPEMMHSKLLQARGYAANLDAQSIVLAIVDPVSLMEDRVIVAASSPRWAELLDEVNERVDQVLAWRDHGTMPARVCSKPGDAHGHFCLHAAHCFDGWQPPAVAVVDDERGAELAVRLAHVRRHRRELAQTDKVLEDEQKEIQTELEPKVPAGEWRLGSMVVNRSLRSGRRSFDFDRAQLDGRIPDEWLAEFTKTGSGFSVWDVKAAPRTDDDVDIYGDDAPWTDADLEGPVQS